MLSLRKINNFSSNFTKCLKNQPCYVIKMREMRWEVGNKTPKKEMDNPFMKLWKVIFFNISNFNHIITVTPDYVPHSNMLYGRKFNFIDPYAMEVVQKKGLSGQGHSKEIVLSIIRTYICLFKTNWQALILKLSKILNWFQNHLTVK